MELILQGDIKVIVGMIMIEFLHLLVGMIMFDFFFAFIYTGHTTYVLYFACCIQFVGHRPLVPFCPVERPFTFFFASISNFVSVRL